MNNSISSSTLRGRTLANKIDYGSSSSDIPTIVGGQGIIATSTGNQYIISLSTPLPIQYGGTGTGDSLVGNSIMTSNGVAIVQGPKGTANTLLHGNDSGMPTYSAVSLTDDVSGLLPINNGGLNMSDTPLNNQILIGNTSNGYNLETLVAGSNVSINRAGTNVTISSTPATVASGPSGAISVSNVGNDYTIDLVTPLAVNKGGTSRTSFPTQAMLIGSPLGNIDTVAPASNTVLGYNGSSNATTFSTLPTAVQSNITSLGTVTSGTWNATPLLSTYVETVLTGKTLNTATINDPTLTGLTSISSGGSNLYVSNAGKVETRDITVDSNKLRINEGGTNSNTGLSGSSIMISDGTGIVQGDKGTTTTVLHGNAAGAPTYGSVSLTNDISGVLDVANGGLNLSSAPAAGNIPIGNGVNYTLAALTAGTGINITNAAGSITIASTSSSSGYPATEYATPGTYTYNIPAGAKFLDMIMQGAGGASGFAPANSNSPGSGGAGMLRKFKVPVDGATTMTVVVGQGGQAIFNNNGGSGTASSITINGKLITAEAGTGGGASSDTVSGGGGSSAGSNIGVAATGRTAGTAGSSTPAAGTFHTISATGMAGASGVLNTIGPATAGNTPSNLSQEAFVIGGSGASGAFGTSRSGARGGSCAGGLFVSDAGSLGGSVWAGGSSGGSSGLAKGGAPGSRTTSSVFSIIPPTAGTLGSGGGAPVGCSDSQQNGAAGGDGYVYIRPI